MLKFRLMSIFTAIFAFWLLAGCSSFALKLATPFKQISANQDSEAYLVVVTYAEYRDDIHSEQSFDDLVDNILGDIDKAEGLYGYSIRKDFFGNSAWTYTIWESDKAVANFKVSEHHLKAMHSAPSVLTNAKFARAQIKPDALPYSWDKALALLDSAGRSNNFSGAADSNQKRYSANSADAN